MQIMFSNSVVRVIYCQGRFGKFIIQYAIGNLQAYAQEGDCMVAHEVPEALYKGVIGAPFATIMCPMHRCITRFCL